MLSEPVPAEPPQPPQAAPAKGGLFLKIAGPIIGLVALVAILGAAKLVSDRYFGGDQVPEVGECLANSINFDDLDVVDCQANDAAWRVVSNAGSMTEQAFDETELTEMCEGAQEGENALWLGEQTDDRSGDGEVVCLAPLDVVEPEAGDE